jgi:putative transposase
LKAAAELAPSAGISATCRALGVSRATLDRRGRPPSVRPPRPRPDRALAPEEELAVLAAVHAERFVDRAPAAIVAALLDEGTYLCSPRSMYRLLEKHGEVRERRDQLRHPAYAAPELLATAPNQVWTWDITKLRGPAKWTYFYLYVLIDLFSRYVVGWMVAPYESGALAKHLIEESCVKQGIQPGELTVHADRGPSMTSKPLALTLADLGVNKSHSRPHVSNDNPFSESHFKTLKYRPEFPDRFGSIEDARAFLVDFFAWYGVEHRHSGIAMLAPQDVHYGRAPQILAARGAVLDAAYALHPERFVRRPPRPGVLPPAVWINPPASGALESTSSRKVTAQDAPGSTDATSADPRDLPGGARRVLAAVADIDAATMPVAVLH